METEMTNTLIDQRTGQPVKMVMQRLDLSGQVYPVGAMLTLAHKFKTEEDGEPFEAVYVSMLPQNGTLRRFTVKGEDFEAKSEMKPREKARESYEEGIQGGHLSVLAETSADGLVSLNVGQVRPGEEITVVMEVVVGVEVNDRGYRFRYPFTVPPGYHAQAKSYATPEGGKQELPASVFGDLILPEWRTKDLHEVSFDIHVESGGVIDSVASPSHRVSVRPHEDGSADVTLAAGDGVPNRDLVIDVKTKKPIFAVFADKSAHEAYLKGETNSLMVTEEDFKPRKERSVQRFPSDAPRWTAVIPSGMVPKAENTPRKVCFVIDRSGSMSGQPLYGAKKALLACLSTLGPDDEFGIVHFGSDAKKFNGTLAKATDKNRKQATRFVEGIEVDGGTHLLGAVSAAFQVIGGPGGDIFLLTDGEVWETGQIIEQAAAVGTRFHTMGIGAASKSKFLTALARRTKGICKLVGPTEDTATSALALLNQIKDPRQVGVTAMIDPITAGKKTSPADVGTVWEGLPILINDQGDGFLPRAIGLRLQDKREVITIDGIRPVPEGLVALLSAGRRLEDLDSVYDVSQEGSPVREKAEKEMEAISMGYGLASRAVSLCSVIERVGDQEGVTPKQQVVPVGTPEGLQQQAYFGSGKIMSGVVPLSSFSLGGSAYASPGVYTMSLCDTAPIANHSFYVQTSQTTSLTGGGFPTASSAYVDDVDYEPDSFNLVADEGIGMGVFNPAVTSLTLNDSAPTDMLLAMLASLEADGGMPDDGNLGRLLRTALVGLIVVNAQVDGGADIYGLHLKRMADFLQGADDLWKAVSGASAYGRSLTALFRTPDRKVEGDWSGYLADARVFDEALRREVWGEISEALKG